MPRTDQLISGLARSRLLRQGVRALRLYKAANFYLHCFPIVKRLPSGVIYRARWLESVLLARQMLELGSMYPPAKLPPHITSFIDLGCNVGYFTCWLAHLSGGASLKGLLVDANAAVVQEAQWHARANHWDQVFAVHGLAGAGPGQSGLADFYLYASNYCSSTSPNAAFPCSWKQIQVPHADVGQLWRQQFGEARCQLLKVDIEGSEKELFSVDQPFLELVDAILVEWHKARLQLPELKTLLAARGFTLVEVIEDKELEGTSLFRRSPR